MKKLTLFFLFPNNQIGFLKVQADAMRQGDGVYEVVTDGQVCGRFMPGVSLGFTGWVEEFIPQTDVGEPHETSAAPAVAEVVDKAKPSASVQRRQMLQRSQAVPVAPPPVEPKPVAVPRPVAVQPAGAKPALRVARPAPAPAPAPVERPVRRPSRVP